jgi:hypothetical protein
MKNMNENKIIPFFKKFFLNYFWLGLVVLLTTIVISEKITTPSFIINVIIETMKTIGISILVASIFSWTFESFSFIQRIQELLRSVVVKRDFLSNLDNESKMDALKSIIKASTIEKNIYANIDDYYNYYIKQTMSMSEKNVRSDYSVNAKIYIDKVKNKIACEQITNYRLYPNENGFGIMRVGFIDEDQINEVSYVRIYKPEGGREEHCCENIKLEEEDFGGQLSRIAKIDLNKYNNEKHLKIEIKVIEYGHDHWISFPFQALQPTDGLRYQITCSDSIQIVTCVTFGQGIDFNIDENVLKTEACVTTYQWVNEGTGIMIVASLKGYTNKSIVDKSKRK